MTKTWETRGAACLAVLVCLLLAGCGGDPEDEKVDLLASDPGASLKSNCDVFLAQVGEKTDWTVVGASETSFTPGTEEEVGATYYAEGCHLGLLKAVLSDKAGKETPFRFVFVSSPVQGTWALRKIGVLDENDAVQTFMGDTDAFYAINANQSRHPSHPDYVGP